MAQKYAGLAKKIILVLLLGVFLNLSLAPERAYSKKKKKQPSTEYENQISSTSKKKKHQSSRTESDKGSESQDSSEKKKRRRSRTDSDKNASSENKKQLPQPDYDNQVRVMKDIFITLYWDLWAQRDLTSRLYNCVAQAVEDYSGIKAFANADDYAKVQEKANNLFIKDFNAFLKELQKQFGMLFSEQVLRYYRDLLQAALDKVEDPTSRANIQETSMQLLFETNAALKGEFSKTTKGSGLVAGGFTTAFVIEAAKFAAAHVFTAMAAQTGITAMTGALGAKLAGGAAAISSIFTIPVLAYGAVKIGNGPENMRNGLYDPMLRNYLYTVPGLFWQPFESPVRDSITGIYADAMLTVTSTEENFEVSDDLKKMMQEYKQRKDNSAIRKSK